MSRVRRFAKRPSDDYCNYEGCDRLKQNRLYCGKHYQRYARYGDPSVVKPHYRSTRKCLIVENGAECQRNHCAKDMCQMHYRRYKLYGDPLFKKVTGDKSPAKYKLIKRKGHANAREDGQILEHRYVMSQHLGRPLTDEETVHHINGDRLDNRIENLELWSHFHPYGQRVKDKVEWAIELLNLYEPERLR